jgi:GNAT superfamily N-acetyltransferase
MKQFPVSLRAASAADANCMAVLATQVWLDTYATDGIRETIAAEVLQSFSPRAIGALIAEPAVTFLLAENNAHLIGFVQWTAGARHALVNGVNPAELDRLYVQQRAAGRGVGTLLLQSAERAVRSQGIDILWLQAWVHNDRALRFYATHAYVDLGNTDFRMGDEVHENRVLAKQLI